MKPATLFIPILLAAALAVSPARGDDVMTNVRIQLFIFELDEKIAQFLLSERTDDTELFRDVMSRFKEGEATIVTAASVVAKSGHRAKVEGFQQVYYATEFEMEKEGRILPVSIDIEHVGTVLEVDPVIGADGETIDLNLAPEHHLAPPVMVNVLDGKKEEGVKNPAALPRFFVEKVTTSTLLKNGDARLLGTVDPAAALAGSGREEAAKGKVHFFFVKADLVR